MCHIIGNKCYFTTFKGIVNLKIENGVADQQTRISKVDGANEHMVVQVLPNNETRIALLGNLFASQGKPGKVITF